MQQPGHGLLAEVTSAVLPLVVLVLEHGDEQAHQGSGVGKDPHHLGAAVELGTKTGGGRRPPRPTQQADYARAA